MRILLKESLLYEKFENSIKFGNNLYSVKLPMTKYHPQVLEDYELSLNRVYQLRERLAHYSFS